ncbi:hypothetical protein PVT67_00575 [Gallaecimonas kandeliae]|uniref:hypothetical protein n=1 Tax=Gallaecimonas kandeliae TaxID=3029055 RepID=UPI002649C3E3|nr:hypothetical protein [Gallaecimonas kandeliae]WKE65784.1 hypothetical protein PVT67_00575 [Gallaecimonas kandeliae]
MTDTSKQNNIQQLDLQFCTAVEHHWLVPAQATEVLCLAIDSLAGSSQAKSDLVWPGLTEHPALLHAMANLRRRGHGDFQGFRTLIYPVMDRGLSDLHRYCVDRDRLKNQGQYLCSQGMFTSAVTQFLFDPASVEDRPDVPRFHPPMRDLIPVFQILDNEMEWPGTDPRVMRDTIRSVARSRRKAIRQNIQAYNAWAKAPSAVIGLGGRLDRKHRIRRLIEAFGAKVMSPDLVILDGRRKVLNGLNICPEQLIHFVQSLAESFPKHAKPPGLWVFFDQPDDWLDFRIRVRQRLALLDDLSDLEVRWLRELLSDAAMHIHTGNWLNTTISETPPSTPIGWPQPYAVDNETTRLASKIIGLIQHPDCGGSLEPSLWRAYLWITGVSNLTIPLRSVENWLVEHPDQRRIHRQWDALEAKKGLIEVLQKGQAGPLHDELHYLVTSMDTLHKHWIAHGQPMVYAFKSSLDRITLQQDRNVHVVVKTFLEKELLAHDYANCGVHFHRSSELKILGSEIFHEPVLFTDMNKPWLDHLLFKTDSTPFEWLLTPRTLRWMKRYLDGLLEAPGLGPLEVRVTGLRDVVKAVLEQPGMDLFMHRPSPEIFDLLEDTLPAYSSPGSFSDGTIRVTLDDGSTRSLWGNQTVYRSKGLVSSLNLEPVVARRLEVGDVILWPDEVLEMAMNQVLSEDALARMMVAKTFVDCLKAYHDNLRTAYARHPAKPELRPEIIRQAMSEALRTDIELSNIKDWLSPILQPDNLHGRSHAPQRYDIFQEFARAVGLPELFVPTYWKGIVRYRGARRVKGRERHAVLLQCLLHPESAAAYCGSEAQALSDLHHVALSQLFTLNAIHTKEATRA